MDEENDESMDDFEAPKYLADVFESVAGAIYIEGDRGKLPSQPKPWSQPSQPEKKICGKNSKRRWMCEGISKI